MLDLKSLHFVLLGLVLSSLVTGCGNRDDGPARFHISGSVTYEGKPVPRGTILLSPDTNKGNTGPSSQLRIVNGRYNSKDDINAAPIAGDLIIQVVGNGPEVPNEEFPAPLFPLYEITFTMPEQDTTFDINVPASR